MTRRFDAEFESGEANASSGFDTRRNVSFGLINYKNHSLTGEPDSYPESEGDGVKCARGSLFAIFIELVAAFCLYAIWRAWQLIR